MCCCFLCAIFYWRFFCVHRLKLTGPVFLNPSAVPMACHVWVTAWTTKRLRNFTLHLLSFLPSLLIGCCPLCLCFIVRCFYSPFHSPSCLLLFFLLPGDQWTLVVLGQWTCLQLTWTNLALNHGSATCQFSDFGSVTEPFQASDFLSVEWEW